MISLRPQRLPRHARRAQRSSNQPRGDAVNEATPHPRREPAAGGYRRTVPSGARGRADGARDHHPWPGPDALAGLWLVLAVIILAVLVTALALKLRSPLYTATMIVAPAQTDLGAASQLASELEQYANLAALAQTPAKLETVSDLERYVQLFGSTTLAARLQDEHGPAAERVRRPLGCRASELAAAAWRPRGIRGRGARVFRLSGVDRARPWPALPNGSTSQIGISRLGGSALLRLRIEHAKPEFAASLLEIVHRAADDLLREESLGRVGGQIAQVEGELAAATTPTPPPGPGGRCWSGSTRPRRCSAPTSPTPPRSWCRRRRAPGRPRPIRC